MKRKIYEELIAWKENKNKIPLMLLGARQVGKTYIINKFCQNEFTNYIGLNLFERPDIVDLYKTRLTSDEKFLKLKALLDFDIELPDTILFIDEIQESEELISELKYFCEKHNNINIIVAGSLLGVKLKRSRFSFPVGKVKMLTLYPMNFEEFLMAFKEENLIQEIKGSYKDSKPILDAFHNKALNYYHLFMATGGMPASVQNIVEVEKDFTRYNTSILNNIVESYFKDMDKYVTSNAESLKIEKTYKSIPSQLSNESNKFQYSKIINGAKSREYESPLDWLEASNLILKSYQVSTPSIPLKGYIKDEYFKIFLSDVGIVSNNLGLKFIDILNDNLSLYKGALAENYVANELKINNYDLFYWQSNGIAEIDFLIYTNDGIIPVEVKASDSTKSKSLNVYIDKFQPKYAIRISTKNFGFANNIKSVPLYAVFCIKD